MMNEVSKTKIGMLLVTLFLLAAWPLSQAADWVRVGPASAKASRGKPIAAKYFVDKSSIIPSGTLYKAWSLTSYAREKNLDDGPTYISVKALNLYSCEEHTTTLQTEVYYADSMGKSAPIRSVKYEKFTPEDIIPDSAADHAFKIVCAKHTADAKNAAATAKAAANAAAAAASSQDGKFGK